MAHGTPSKIIVRDRSELSFNPSNASQELGGVRIFRQLGNRNSTLRTLLHMATSSYVLRGLSRFITGAPSLIGIAGWIDLGAAGYVGCIVARNWQDGAGDLLANLFGLSLLGISGGLGLWSSAGRTHGPGPGLALKASGALHLIAGVASLATGSGPSNILSRVLGLVLTMMGIAYLRPLSRRTSAPPLETGQTG